MSAGPLFKGAFPYQQDVLALPVVDLDAASLWYANAFGLRELERLDHPHQAVILERDGIKIGFAVNGGDASQDGAAILVSDIRRAREEVEAKCPTPGSTIFELRSTSAGSAVMEHSCPSQSNAFLTDTRLPAP